MCILSVEKVRQNEMEDIFVIKRKGKSDEYVKYPRSMDYTVDDILSDLDVRTQRKDNKEDSGTLFNNYKLIKLEQDGMIRINGKSTELKGKTGDSVFIIIRRKA